ncbi:MULTISPECIES: hypothetical protein [unclassified Adlercreutzia]|uniref:hypothetical protein n=1 Tax=unclassified Adlercreutzia TaxID=2636013 RepID=UPI0013EC96E5|nr:MULTISPECIES: hypothetical protein [unclassified Adlercreutzia]
MEHVTHTAKPTPSEAEQSALKRLMTGQGSRSDAKVIRMLVDCCGRYGCVYTRPSKTSPGMKECPGWCNALEVYDKQRAARDAAASNSPESKTGKLARDERAALQALEREKAGTKDALALMLLSDKCAKDGCVSKDDTEGICPGWCATAHQAWDAWWL